MQIKLNIWIRVLFPLFLTLYLGFLLFMMSQFREPPEFRWYGLLWFAATIYLIWESGWRIGIRLNSQYPWEKGASKRLLVQLLATNLAGIAIYLLLYILINAYENFILKSNNPLSIYHLLVATTLAILIVQIINSIQIGYQLLEQWQKTQIEAEKVRKEKAINQLDTIRQAFDRHFLLDHLAELEGLIEENPREANAYLQKISEAYNNNLNHLDNQLEGVQNELQVTTLPDGFLRKKDIERPMFSKNKKRFFVRSGPKFTVVPTEQIAGFYKDDLVLLITMTGKKYVVDSPLEELKGKLPNEQFYRINRQCIININALQEVRPEGTQLLLTLFVDFPKPLYVSQRNVASFKKWLDDDE